MADTIQFDLVSPERLVASEPVEMVVVPGGEGDLGVLPGHSLLIGTVRPGVIDIHEGGKVKAQIFVAGGFAEVTAERCTVLAEEAVAARAAAEALAAKTKADADVVQWAKHLEAWRPAAAAQKGLLMTSLRQDLELAQLIPVEGFQVETRIPGSLSHTDSSTVSPTQKY